MDLGGEGNDGVNFVYMMMMSPHILWKFPTPGGPLWMIERRGDREGLSLYIYIYDDEAHGFLAISPREAGPLWMK